MKKRPRKENDGMEMFNKIIGKNLENGFDELKFTAVKTYESDKFDVWCIRDTQLDTLNAYSEETEKFFEIFDEGAWYRADDCDYKISSKIVQGEFNVNGKKMQGLVNVELLKDMNESCYDSEDEYLSVKEHCDYGGHESFYYWCCEEWRRSYDHNQVPLIFDTAKRNKMSVEKFLSEFQGKGGGGEHMSEYNYSKLRGRIREILGTEQVFAEEMKFSKVTASAKLNGKVEFLQSEIDRACVLLQIEPTEIAKYFFCQTS